MEAPVSTISNSMRIEMEKSFYEVQIRVFSCVERRERRKKSVWTRFKVFLERDRDQWKTLTAINLELWLSLSLFLFLFILFSVLSVTLSPTFELREKSKRKKPLRMLGKNTWIHGNDHGFSA